MDSDSSSFVHTTYSVDLSIEKIKKRNEDERLENQANVACERREMYEDFVTNFMQESFEDLSGLHFYKFTETKIKFGFNPSEVAHVSKKIKFICILKYTGNYWILGRNTIPANWKERIFGLFYRGKSVDDSRITTIIVKIHWIFMEWSKEHAAFRRRKIEKYRNGEIDFFELDSEDEELHLNSEERRKMKEKRERILQRMIPPKRQQRKKRVALERDDLTMFQPIPYLELDSE